MSTAGSWEVEAEEKTLYGQVEEAVLSSLRPATVYQVRVAAENELGRSKEGRVLQVKYESRESRESLEKSFIFYQDLICIWLLVWLSSQVLICFLLFTSKLGFCQYQS